MAAGTSSSSSSSFLLPPPLQHNLGGSLPFPGTLSHRCSDGNPSGNNGGRKAAEDKDFISELPDSMIFEIFSFMPIEEIVRTSILSRRWRFIWTGARTITFSCSDILCTPRIDRFFNQCTALAIQKLQIGHGYAPFMKDNIDRCISFAVARGVKDMELNFSTKIVSHEPRGRYVLPGILLSCRFIVRLHLCYCSLKAVKDCGINWGSLKALCIDDALLEGRLLDEILDGSPSLEHIELKCCFGARRIRILSTRIKELVIDGHKLRIDYSRFNTGGDDVSLEIDAPYLQSLRILGDLSKITSIKLNEVSSLVDAELNVLGLVKWHGEVFPKVMVKELLTRLGGVHKLAIGRHVLPVLRVIEAKEGCYFDLTCRQLTLRMKSSAEMWDLFGIAAALRCAPVMEKLVVNSAHARSSEDEYLSKWIPLCYPSIFGGDPFVKPNGIDASCMANHLRSIEIFGWGVTTDWKSWLPLIEFLLREALVLEEMTIHINNRGLNSFSEEILGYVRGSVAARIVFIHPGGRTTSSSPL